MPEKNYDQKVKQLTAYCAIQYKLLEMYHSSTNTFSMLKELSQPIIKAMRKRKERDLKSLEEISKKIDEKILTFQKQKPEIANSEEVKRMVQTLNDMKKEYGG